MISGSHKNFLSGKINFPKKEYPICYYAHLELCIIEPYK